MDKLIWFGIISVLLGVQEAHSGTVYKIAKESIRKVIEEEPSNRNVIYEFEDAVDPSIRDCIERSMKEISRFSCVRFLNSREMGQQNSTALLHLRFSPSDSSSHCQSSMHEIDGGRITEPINVTLGSTCGGQDRECFRSVLLGLGFAMEHERPDRFQYIHINRSNVRTDAIGLFERILSLDTVDLVTKYDISSIMHFTAQESSKSRDSVVLTSNNHFLDESIGGEIRGRRHMLSHRDKLTINYLFHCSALHRRHDQDALGRSDAPPCAKNGYGGENGECVCPHAFSGSKCEILAYSARFNVPTCGILTEREGEILSPNYPTRYGRGAFCQWLIEGGANSKSDRILFRINDLDLEYEHLMPGDRCSDKLTVWPHGTDVVTKSVSCIPDELSNNPNSYKIGKWYSTQYNWLLIEFRSDPWGQYDYHRGFNISYKIIEPPTPRPSSKKTQTGHQDHDWLIRAKGPASGSHAKDDLLDYYSGHGKSMIESSVRTRLLNTIASRHRSIACYECENETDCQIDGAKNDPLSPMSSLRRRTCAMGQACGYQTSEPGVITWRGCIDLNVCTETWDLLECMEAGMSPMEKSQHCFQCCATDFCNTIITNEYLQISSSGSSKMLMSTIYIACGWILMRFLCVEI